MCITKVCTKCPENGEQSIEAFYKNKTVCKECYKKAAIKWQKDNKEKQRRYTLNYYNKNKNKYHKQSKEWYKNNHKRSLEIASKCNIRDRINLTNNYIKGFITRKNGLKYSDIPNDIVELQREAIQLHRQLKTMQDGCTK